VTASKLSPATPPPYPTRGLEHSEVHAMTLTPEQLRLRAIVGALSRYNPNSRELLLARQDYLASQVEHHALEVAAQTPTLRPEQRARIAAILRTILSSDELAASA
jgi:hypothetical protein